MMTIIVPTRISLPLIDLNLIINVKKHINPVSRIACWTTSAMISKKLIYSPVNSSVHESIPSGQLVKFFHITLALDFTCTTSTSNLLLLGGIVL